MADSFTKLWHSILDSSIWSYSDRTVRVWITLMAMADQNGFVGASLDGLARRANVPIEDVKNALDVFMAPDPLSRNRDDDGRRVEEVPRGWHLINYSFFRDLRDKEARKEYERVRKRDQRSRKVSRTLAGHQGTDETNAQSSPMSAQEEAEADHPSKHAGDALLVPESEGSGTAVPGDGDGPTPAGLAAARIVQDLAATMGATDGQAGPRSSKGDGKAAAGHDPLELAMSRGGRRA